MRREKYLQTWTFLRKKLKNNGIAQELVIPALCAGTFAMASGPLIRPLHRTSNIAAANTPRFIFFLYTYLHRSDN